MAHNLLKFLRFGTIISDSLFTRIVVQSFCFVSSLTPHVRHQTQIEFNQERASVPSDGACCGCGQGHGCCADPHPPSPWMLPCHPSLHYFKMILLLCWCCLLVLQRKFLLRGRLCCGRLRGGKLSVRLLLLPAATEAIREVAAKQRQWLWWPPKQRLSLWLLLAIFFL